MRIDKWLWVCRFYKSRSMAQTAVNGGKVHCNQSRIKPGHTLKLGDEITLTLGFYKMTVKVLGFAEHRKNATFAQTLYQETEQSKQNKLLLKTQHRSVKPLTKPDKKNRRLLLKMKRG